MSIKRYTPAVCSGKKGYMQEDESGEYVSYEDYKGLRDRCRKLSKTIYSIQKYGVNICDTQCI